MCPKISGQLVVVVRKNPPRKLSRSSVRVTEARNRLCVAKARCHIPVMHTWTSQCEIKSASAHVVFTVECVHKIVSNSKPVLATVHQGVQCTLCPCSQEWCRLPCVQSGFRHNGKAPAWAAEVLAVSLCGPPHTNGSRRCVQELAPQGSPVPEAEDKEVQSQDATGIQRDIGDTTFHDVQSPGSAMGRGTSSPAMTGSASKCIRRAWNLGRGRPRVGSLSRVGRVPGKSDIRTADRRHPAVCGVC